MPAIGAAGITEGTREAGCGKWDIRAERIGCRLTTRAVNRNCDWFKTRHSLAIDVPKKDGCRGTGTIAGAAAGVSGLPTDTSARSKAARASRSLRNPVHWIPGMADQENGSCKWFRWGGEPHNHSTPAAHGPQSASPCGCHQGRHAPPDANWWDETRILCRRPSGLVGPRLTQAGAVFSRSACV